MKTETVPIEDCRHVWWLVLGVDQTVALHCEPCGASDRDAFKQCIANLIELQIGDTRIVYGHHDYAGGEAWIPVNLYVTQSMSYDVQAREFNQEARVTVTPRELAPDPNVIDSQVLGSYIEEVEVNTEALLAAIDRQDRSHVDEAPHGTGWCAPSP